MNRTEYKNNFYKEHYERINLAVPKGMKEKSKEFFGEERVFKRKPVYAKSERRETRAERKKGIQTTS